MLKRSREDAGLGTQYSSEEIVQIVRTIKEYNGSSKEKNRHFRKSVPEFAENYPSLFQMACEKDFDMHRLEFMLSMRDNVATNRISQHQASVRVGENLFTEYVKPLVDKADKEMK